MSASTLLRVGKVVIESGVIFISDPCYIPDSLAGNGIEVVNVEPDTKWWGAVETSDEGEWGERVNRIYLTKDITFGVLGRPSVVGYVYVDSGQMMLCDGGVIADWGSPDFPADDEALDLHAGRLDYGGACHATLKLEPQAGILGDELPRAVVSSTGYGDGTYPVLVWRDRNNEIVRVAVEFIGEYADSEDEDDEDDGEW